MDFMFLLIHAALVMFFHVIGSNQTLVKKDTYRGTNMYEKRGTPLLPVPLLEVFELTRFIETSNEDPMLYVYTTLITSLRR